MYTILHLEKSRLYKTLVSSICSEIGAAYLNAETAEEAAQFLEKEEVSLIITAMELEGGSSVDFIKAVNETEYSRIPIVVFTGNDSIENRKMMYELGIVDYIHKSTDQETVKLNILTLQKEETAAVQMQTLSYAVLDDNKMDKKIIERIFSMLQISNVTFFDSEQELTAADKMYDIYLVDFVLRETTGDKVIIHLKEKYPECVIIAMSGIDNVKTISRILSLGADDFLNKPFNYELFIARIKTNVRSYMLLQDVKAKTDKLASMAVTDSMTGLYNRRYIFDRLAQEIEKNIRYGSKLSLIMLDIDHFKKFNDTYGHPFGDEIIKKVTQVICSSIRNIDIAGRYGGEEFLVILPENGIEGAMVVAERVRENVKLIDTGIADLSVTISGGTAEFHGGDISEFITKVDTLLYKAKEGGRNRIEK